MNARPPKLPMPAQLVVWASRELTPTQKILWYHHWWLDQGGPDGCYASPKSLAVRCGTTSRVIEECRSELGAFGLLHRLKRIEGKTQYGWCAWIPGISMMPRTFNDARDHGPALAAELDHHLRAYRAGPTLAPGQFPGSNGVSAPVAAGQLPR